MIHRWKYLLHLIGVIGVLSDIDAITSVGGTTIKYVDTYTNTPISVTNILGAIVLSKTYASSPCLLIFGVNASGQNLFAPAFGYGNDYLNPSSTDKQTQIRVFYID